MNSKKPKIKFYLIVICLSFFSVFPQIILAAQNEQTAITVTFEDIYQEIKEMGKEIQEIKHDMVTKEELSREIIGVREEISNVREEISNVRQDLSQAITAIWQTMIGFIVALIVTLLSIKYFIFRIDTEKVKNSLLESKELQFQIKDYIKKLFDQTKKIL